MGNARIKICQIVDEFVREVGKKQVGECAHVVSALINAFRAEMTSKVKCAILKPLQILLELEMVNVESNNITDLISWLFDDFSAGRTGTSKTSNTCQAEILVTLGMLGNRFPASMSQWAKSIVGACLHKLRSPDSKNTPYVSYCGATKCLCFLLKDYSTYLKKRDVEFVYNYILGSLDFSKDLKRYTLALNTLEILRTHTTLFRDCIMKTDETVQTLFRTMLTTCRHANRQLYRSGLQTMDAAMNEIANCISLQGRSRSNVFRWLLATLSGLIEDNSSPRNIIVGISGCGHLASSIAILAPNQVVTVIRRLIKFASRLESKVIAEDAKNSSNNTSSNLFVRQERDKDIAMNRARFLSTISSLVLELKEDPPADITREIVENVQSLIAEYPDLYKGYRTFICMALSRAYASLVDKSGSAMTTLLDQTIDHALIRTVSSRAPQGQENQEEKEGEFYDEKTGLVERRLLFPYLSFWISMLTTHNDSLSNWGASSNAGSRVVKEIYGELLGQVLKRFELLDLRVHEIQEEEKNDNDESLSTEPLPMYPKDYTIFLNLVVFCEKLLPERCVRLFEKSWLVPTLQCLIRMDRRFDGEVSGVYVWSELLFSLFFSHVHINQTKHLNHNGKTKLFCLQVQND